MIMFWAMIAVLNMPMYHMSTTPQNISEKATGTPIAMAPSREPTKTRRVIYERSESCSTVRFSPAKAAISSSLTRPVAMRTIRSSAIRQIPAPVNNPIP